MEALLRRKEGKTVGSFILGKMKETSNSHLTQSQNLEQHREVQFLKSGIIYKQHPVCIQNYWKEGKLSKRIQLFWQRFPKIPDPTNQTHLKPIDSGNVMFKCITKLGSRTKAGLTWYLKTNVCGRKVNYSILTHHSDLSGFGPT